MNADMTDQAQLSTAWMQQARRREFRMIDSSILGVLVSGVSIFASTNIFVIGGLIADWRGRVFVRDPIPELRRLVHGGLAFLVVLS